MELHTHSKRDRIFIRRMMDLYLYDFSKYTGSDLGDHGYSSYGDLAYLRFELTYRAFTITADKKPAGFALVDDDVVIDSSDRSITDFFIMRKFRRQGIGKLVAREVFINYPPNRSSVRSTQTSRRRAFNGKSQRTSPMVDTMKLS